MNCGLRVVVMFRNSLECLSKPRIERFEADECASEEREGQMNIGTSFVADGEATEPGDPCEGSFDDPTMPAEILAAFDTPAGDAMPDIALRAGDAAAPVVVSLVGMELCGTMFRAAAFTPDGGDRIEHGFGHPAVMDVGAREQDG